MVIQNNSFTGKSKIKRMISFVFVIICSSIFLFWDVALYEFGVTYSLSWIQTLLFTTLVFGVYGIIVWFRFRKKYYFVYVTDDDNENLVFRFYHIRTFGKKFNTYKIPFIKFHSFEINQTNGNTDLYLFQKVNNSVAKYPPISLNAYSQEELHDLRELLTNYLPK
ncbi:MAG TPA: hypothetical protein PK199_09460 [Bacteroidales bacterium]|nr:hypothetical protein [Bacteroidales bacterium]